MPKLTLSKHLLTSLLHPSLQKSPLPWEKVKAELEGEDSTYYKVEFNDTNRPDLWSCAGLARQMNLTLAQKPYHYAFSSPQKGTQGSYGRIHVDPRLQHVRPYIAAFYATGPVVTALFLEELIQVQEKVSWNYGQKRRRVAIGLYPASEILFPLHYTLGAPSTQFTPLGERHPLSLKTILNTHPKGKEFSHLLQGLSQYPLLKDANKNILSLPPIINSHGCGELQEGDKEIFLEVTGTDSHQVLLSCAIFATLLHDHGFSLDPLEIHYPFATSLGRCWTTPCLFQKPMTVSLKKSQELLGVKLSCQELREALSQQGWKVSPSSDSAQTLTVDPLIYRNDILDPVDLIEEVMISLGLDAFSPTALQSFSKGSLLPQHQLQEKIQDILVGLGFQQMIYNCLVSKKDCVEKSLIDPNLLLTLKNPLSEQYDCLRPFLFPSLLATEAHSQHVLYPHAFFEIGEVAQSHQSGHQAIGAMHLAFMMADKEATLSKGLNMVHALIYYLQAQTLFSLQPYHSPYLLEGRAGQLMLGGKPFGFIGEVHPGVLQNWNITVPSILCEWDCHQWQKLFLSLVH